MNNCLFQVLILITNFRHISINNLLVYMISILEEI